MKRALWVCLLGGCILPVSTGAPLPATTVGKGNLGGAISGEAPTLDLIADNDAKQNGANTAIAYGAAPAASMTFTFSYGLGDNTDLEVAGEGALYYFILPLPTGGTIGLRQHFDAGDSLDIAVAGKLGHVGGKTTITDSNGNSSSTEASANYGAVQVVVQTKRGSVRPLLALSELPATVYRDPGDTTPFRYKGVASSVTGGVMLVGDHALIGPYVTVTNFYSDKFDNSGWFVSGGLVFAIRPDRSKPREPVVPPAPPMSAPPGPPAPPGPATPPPNSNDAPPMPPPPPPDPTTPPLPTP